MKPQPDQGDLTSLSAASGTPLYVLVTDTTGTSSLEPVTVAEFLAWDEVKRSQSDLLVRGAEEARLEVADSGPPPRDAFTVRWNELLALTPSERVAELVKERKKFDEAVQSPSVAEQGERLVALTETAFLVNRASLGTNARASSTDTTALVRETRAMVKSVVDLLVSSPHAADLVATMERLSTGQTLGHMVRVFTLVIDFFVFYGRQHERGLNRQIRKGFSASQRAWYRRVLPSLGEGWLTSDNLVRLAPIAPAKIREFGLGALLHDVGKVLDLDFFEHATLPDRKKIRQHPLLGSGLFLRAYGNTHEDARHLVGDHHHYLGHADGYGLTRWERAQSQRQLAAAECCVADKLADFVSGRALGYLPIEVCSLIDIFDALTDPMRQYKPPATRDEA